MHLSSFERCTVQHKLKHINLHTMHDNQKQEATTTHTGIVIRNECYDVKPFCIECVIYAFIVGLGLLNGSCDHSSNGFCSALVVDVDVVVFFLLLLHIYSEWISCHFIHKQSDEQFACSHWAPHVVWQSDAWYTYIKWKRPLSFH